MRKLFIVLCFCFIASKALFAQIEEVKYVITTKVENSEEKGFEFENLNRNHVFVEAELRMPCPKQKLGYVVIDTKYFVLKSRGKFFWNVPLEGNFEDYCEPQNTYVVVKAFYDKSRF